MSSFSIDPVAALAKIIAFHAQGLRDDTDNARAIADSLLLPIIVCSRDLTYRWVSKEVARVLGHSTDELIGRPIVDVIGQEAFDALKPKFDRVLAGEYLEDDERLYGTSADWRWVRVVYTPTFGPDGIADGWVSMLFDFDEQRQAIEKLRDNEARLRELVDTVPAIVWLGDTEGDSAFVNKYYEQYIGLSNDEVRKQWRLRLHPDDRANYVRGYEDAVKRSADWHAFFRMPRYDGVYRWFEVKAVPRFDGDRFVGYTGCAFDITERKVAEEALLEANRQKEEFIAVLGTNYVIRLV